MERNFDLPLNVLTVKEILEVCQGNISVSRTERCNKDALIRGVVDRGTDEFLSTVSGVVRAKLDAIRGSRKRVREDKQEQRRVVRRIDSLTMSSNWQEEHDVSQFMDLPSQEQVKDCYRMFYEQSGTRAVELGICGVCAREVNVEHQENVQFAYLCLLVLKRA